MRIQGITIPDDKQLEFALTAIYGIGRARAKSILSKVGIDSNKKPTDLSAEDENKIREVVEKRSIFKHKENERYRIIQREPTQQKITSARPKNQDQLSNSTRECSKDYGFRTKISRKEIIIKYG
jgi:ribosomal protein S13